MRVHAFTLYAWVARVCHAFVPASGFCLASFCLASFFFRASENDDREFLCLCEAACFWFVLLVGIWWFAAAQSPGLRDFATLSLGVREFAFVPNSREQIPSSVFLERLMSESLSPCLVMRWFLRESKWFLVPGIAKPFNLHKSQDHQSFPTGTRCHECGPAALLFGPPASKLLEGSGSAPFRARSAGMSTLGGTTRFTFFPRRSCAGCFCLASFACFCFTSFFFRASESDVREFLCFCEAVCFWFVFLVSSFFAASLSAIVGSDVLKKSCNYFKVSFSTGVHHRAILSFCDQNLTARILSLPPHPPRNPSLHLSPIPAPYNTMHSSYFRPLPSDLPGT